jgi:hypothetical protein
MIFRNKKAQGISINVIIIAAIALLVLVVLSIIFVGRLNIFGVKTTACESVGGTCYVDCPTGTSEYSAGARCPDVEGVKQKCCLAIS